MTSSSFSWLDYSEQDRRKMLDVVELFAERDVRDELGLGAVRDAFADLFFPGTGTMQTRARYFLFIPWLYMGLERRRVRSKEVRAKARTEEISLIRALKRAGETRGVIGDRSEDRLLRLPSSIYWSGLQTWGICLCPYSQTQYHRSLDSYYRALDALPSSDDELDATTSFANWHTGLPGAEAKFPYEATFALTYDEADYLRERILTSCRGSLLASLIDLPEAHIEAAFPWLHPALGEFSDRIREQLDHAELFSVALHGAALLYNLMLAEQGDNGELGAAYRDWIGEWATAVEGLRPRLLKWDMHRLWLIATSRGAKIPPPTQRFAEDWVARLIALGAADSVADDPVSRTLISEREWRTKRNQARLHNRRALELWTGAAGTGQLTYRWPTARVLIDDIITGLQGERTDA